MSRYYRITAVLHEDELNFVREVAETFGCSIGKAISVCVVWARMNKDLIKTLESVKAARLQGRGKGSETDDLDRDKRSVN